jgi:hypothetical protein
MLGHAISLAKMLSLVTSSGLNALSESHKAERGAKGLSCWSQFVAKSLREIVDGLACSSGCCCLSAHVISSHLVERMDLTLTRVNSPG